MQKFAKYSASTVIVKLFLLARCSMLALYSLSCNEMESSWIHYSARTQHKNNVILPYIVLGPETSYNHLHYIFSLATGWITANGLFSYHGKWSPLCVWHIEYIESPHLRNLLSSLIHLVEPLWAHHSMLVIPFNSMATKCPNSFIPELAPKNPPHKSE